MEARGGRGGGGGGGGHLDQPRSSRAHRPSFLHQPHSCRAH